MSRAIEKDEQEEALQIGRVLGKADKDLLKKLDQIAKAKKKKKSEIVKEAIELYDKLQMLDGLDSRTLMAGFFFWKEMMEMSIESLAKLAPIYSSNLVQSQMDMIAQIIERLNQTRQQQEQQQPSAPATEDPTKAVVENIRATLLQKVLEILTNTLVNMPLGGISSLNNLNQLSSSTQSAQTTSEVPIEIIEK